MSFTAEQRYRGGMAAKARAEQFERETGKNWYAHITKGHPRRPRPKRKVEASRPTPVALSKAPQTKQEVQPIANATRATAYRFS